MTKRVLIGHGIIVACMLAVSAGTSPAIHAQSLTKPPEEHRKPTEVIVVGTHHFITDMPEDYTPGHLRALLEKISPDVLAVEIPSNVPDPWKMAATELTEVVRPWAERREIEVVPCGWHDPQYAANVTKAIQAYASTKEAGEYQNIETRLQKEITAQPASCQFVNSDAYNEVWREYHHDLHKLAGNDTAWEAWNAKILDNVLEVCKSHSGKRIAVVLGAAHAYYLLDGLSERPTVKAVSTEEFFPLTDEEVATSSRPIDYLKALRPLNLDVLSPDQIVRLKPFLDQVKQEPEFTGDYHLFRGKLLLHERKPQEALAEFEQLGRYQREELMKFDNASRYFETGLIYSAMALYQTGDVEAARQRLENVIQDKDITPQARQWAKQVLAGMPPNRTASDN